MFSNFIFFLVALIIYATSDLVDQPAVHDPSGWIYSLMLAVLFVLVCHLNFKYIILRARGRTFASIDHAISAATARLSVLALVVFAANIYVYRLNAAFSDIQLFQVVPTLEAVLFLALFVLYLVIVWNAAYRAQKAVYLQDVSRKNYIVSNLSFSLPALLPWFFLSLSADLIRLFPYGPVARFFSTPAGEIGYILVFLCAIAVFGPVLIKTMWQCRPMEPGPARSRIEAVCARAGLQYADILKWNLFGGTMITAGVMGLVGRFRYILVTPALVNSLNQEEMEAVMLHEIGHVHHRHMLFYLLFFAGFIACNFVFFEPVMLLLFIAEPVYQVFAFLGLEKNQAHPVMICVLLIAFFIAYFRFGFGLFMRNFERQADIHMYRFYPDAAPLIRTFYKIATLGRQAMDRPNWHHFSIAQRIGFLEKCQADPALIDAHHRRVKYMTAGFVLVLAGLFWTGYSINYGRLQPAFENFVAGHLLFQQMEVTPENADLYVFVGDYYYNKNEFFKAEDAWENVLRIDRDNVHALNNLAWLYATCPDQQVCNHEKALDLASRAVAISKAPYILDTYAEALFVNNRVQEAVAAARQALALTDDRHSYYRGQVARFEEHARAL